MKDEETCKRCGGFRWYLRMDESQWPEFCADCMEMIQSQNSVTHHSRIRCPHCLAEYDASDHEGEQYIEDGHDAMCDTCNKDFRFVTHVEYKFESPALEITKDANAP